MTSDRMYKFSVEIHQLIAAGPLTPDNAEKLGRIIRRELDREYRRGYAAGLREERLNEQRRREF